MAAIAPVMIDEFDRSSPAGLTSISITAASPQPPRIADGTLEGIKWLALVLMTVDHVNKYLLHESVAALFLLGRIAMPLFVFVLAYNLARPDAVQNGSVKRTMRRLLVAGTAASIPYIALGTVAGWWPLNILFTLLAATSIIAALASGGKAYLAGAAVVFIVGGALVEYWWPALLLAVASWAYAQRPTTKRLAALICTLVALAPINGNLWAIAALPVILGAPHLHVTMRRRATLFYVYYPAHLAAVWAVRAVIA